MNGCCWNILCLSDSYKITHYLQYPKKTTEVYSYFESRGGKFPETVFFGLQYVLKRWLCGPVVTLEKIQDAKATYQKHFNATVFNEAGWMHILEKHNGYLPVRIKAVPEGSIVPISNVLFTVENTDPECFWLTNYLETLLVQTWYPLTVATNSYEFKKVIFKYLSETADDVSVLPFMLHDFGCRGVSSMESAAIGGAAHLVNFKGTDTIPALHFAKEYYNCDMAGFSIPATEHSTMTAWGEAGEEAAYRNLLQTFPEGPVACVSDSYNIYNACEKLWGEALHDEVVNRRGTLVIRPDSGKPDVIVLEVLEILARKFGSEVNQKGYKMLPSFLRIIQGDGINLTTLEAVLTRLKEKGWSAANVTFGSGGGLLQQLNRDTQKCAFKCSHVTADGVPVDVFKHPITDPAKNSKKGRLSLHQCQKTKKYYTVEQGKGDLKDDLLVTVFENGCIVRDYSLDEIRVRAELPEVLKFQEKA